jgi:hypothetical protein
MIFALQAFCKPLELKELEEMPAAANGIDHVRAADL